MTTHLSARLAWHDRGWDGRVCDEPHLSSCVVHQHIRDSRDEKEELAVAGKWFAELGGWCPPCSRYPGAFSPTVWSRRITQKHRDEGVRLPLPQLVTSEDGPDGRIDASEIERTARRRSMGE